MAVVDNVLVFWCFAGQELGRQAQSEGRGGPAQSRPGDALSLCVPAARPHRALAAGYPSQGVGEKGPTASR